MKKFGHVFWFHFQESVLSKASLATAAIMFVVVLGFFGISYLMNQGVDEVDIVVIEETENFALDQNQLNDLWENVNFTFRSPSELEASREEVENGDVTHVLVIQEENGVPFLTNIYKNRIHFESVSMVSQSLQQMYFERVMVEDEVSPEVAGRLLTPIEILDEPIRDHEEVFQSVMVFYVFGFALMMILTVFGQSIAMSVVSEKSSRVMEVMISKVKPVYMMYAKVVAVFANVVVILLVGGSGALVAYTLGWLDFENISVFGAAVDFSIIGADVLVSAVIFFILGYFLYGMLYATIGAICSKVETLQSMSSPIQIVVLIPFFIGMFAPGTSLVSQIASYIPFFTPFVMLSRQVAGDAGMLEVGISMAIMLISIIVAARLAARIYVNGVQHYSEKVSFKDVKKLMQNQ